MEEIAARFTVFFEEPFWVGVYEREDGGGYAACKVTFGAEPRDGEVYEFLLTHWRELRFSPSAGKADRGRKRTNPKRARREAGRQTQAAGVGAKAQQALKLQQEQGRQARGAVSRERREAERERRFEQRQEKRKAKHRGH